MRRPEQALQCAIASWMRLVLPPPEAGGPVWTAVNPVPGKTPAVAAISKAMGLRAGFPDIVMIWQCQAIVFELKAGRGTTSDVQDVTLAALDRQGARCFIVRSIDDMRDAVRSLGIATRERAA